MGVFAFEDEHVSTVDPAKLYKALAKDSDTIIPKAVEAIQSIEIVEGNGGPGTIKKLTVVEGAEDILEKVSFETKVLPGPNGGSLGKVSVKYHTKGDAALPEEVRESTKAKGTALFKAVEGYVLANPDY